METNGALQLIQCLNMQTLLFKADPRIKIDIF